MLDINKLKNIHFVGIGGIGMSGLAKIFLWQGKKVSGSDLVSSKNILDLEKMGVKIFLGKHNEKNLPKNTDLVVYTQAANLENPEIKAAKKKGIRILSYPETLGYMTKKKFSICISGTHGKTTTTSLASLLLDKAGFDPTCLIGSNLKEFKGNARRGKSRYFVLEADEYKSSFLNYWPKIIILTTIEYEHPDYFKNLDHMLGIYKKYIKHLPKNGVLVANADDKNVMKLIKSAKCKVITYGTKNQKSDFTALDIKLEGGYPSFKITNKFQIKKSKLQNFKLNIPGIHNIYNALAIIALAQKLKIDLNIVQKVLANFHGAWRRFEYKGEIKDKDITIIDDYAHHPTEIKATLRAARERFPKQKIICIFQPHQYQRTKFLFNDFTKAFYDADQVIIPEIYYVAGREKKLKGINSTTLAAAIIKEKVNAKYISTFSEILKYLKDQKLKNCVIITMGAGDVTKLSDTLIKKLSKVN